MFTLGIIGAGIMGERLARAAIEHAADTVRLTGVWDPAEAALARFAVAAPGVPALEPAALIAACDCVYVASPPASHLTHAQAALDAGRALFCEKPLAVNVEAASAFVAGAAGKRAAVNFPFASSFAVERLRGWLDAGAVGANSWLAIEVAFAEWPRAWQHHAASWLDGPAEGGFTREVVSHFLFLARRLCGPLALHNHTCEFPDGSTLTPNASERHISATLNAGDLPVSLLGAVGSTEKEDHNVWTLTGDAGAIRLRDWSIAERQGPDGAWVPDPDALPNPEMRPLVLRRQLEGVARMTAGEPHSLATLEEALEVQRVVEAIIAHRPHG